MDDLIDSAIVLLGEVVLLAVMVVLIYYSLGKMPKKYHVCSSGWNGVCFTVKDKKDIIKKDNCVSDGVSQICGTYEISQY